MGLCLFFVCWFGIFAVFFVLKVEDLEDFIDGFWRCRFTVIVICGDEVGGCLSVSRDSRTIRPP